MQRRLGSLAPLIGSVDGIENTPAYRGVALAVFENLELAEFGNRIPFLTFEIVADAVSPAIADILEDASRGAITCDAEQTLVGYAAYGRSIKAAIEPLVDCFAVELFDDGSQVRGPQSSVVEIIELDDLGNSANNEQQSRMQREQLAVRAVPAVLRLSYYDPTRDYQSGDARASTGDQRGNEEQQELPAAINDATAKALAQQLLARRWAARDRLALRLPPRHADIEPGTRVDIDLNPVRWTVEKCTNDGLVTVLELRPSWTPSVVMPGVATTMSARSVVVENEPSVALFDVPDVFGHSWDEPILLLAASTAAAGWKRRVARLQFANQSIDVRTAPRKSVLGRALNALPPGEPYLIDALSSVDVQLVDPDQWLLSCDDEALAGGSNLAVLGSELIQFGDAVALGQGRFQLTRLLRGRGGTEWAASIHAQGDAFVLIEPESLQPVMLPSWATGASVEASTGSGARAEATLSAESLRPLSPVRVEATIMSNGDLAVGWVRRSRKGIAWIDEVDAPLGETREEYRVILIGSAASLEFSTARTNLTIAANVLLEVGTGPATIEVRQVGDWAVSRPAGVSISL